MQQTLKSNDEQCSEVRLYRCRTCGSDKKAEDFYFHDREKTRIKSICKVCERYARSERYKRKHCGLEESHEFSRHSNERLLDLSLNKEAEEDFQTVARAFEILLGIDRKIRAP